MKTSFCLLCFLCCTSFLKGQNIAGLSYMELDSVRKIYSIKQDYQKAIFYSEAAVEQAAKIRGTQDSLYSSLLIRLAMMYMKSGRYSDSENCYYKVLKIRKKILGEEHYLYANTLNDLAHCLSIMGRFEESEKYYLETVSIRKKTIDVSHRLYGQSLSNLANLYKRTGRYEEAEHLYLEALKLYADSSETNTIFYATSLNNLGILYKGMDKFPEAEVLFLRAIDVFKSLKKEQHSTFFTLHNNLASVYKAMNKPAKAERLYLKVVEMRAQTLGKKHASYALTLNNLATLYEGIEAYDKAEPLYKEAKGIFLAALGEQHAYYMVSLNNLARMHKAKENFEYSKQLYLTSIAINCSNFVDLFPNVFPKILSSNIKFHVDSCQLNWSAEDYLKVENLDYQNYTTFRIALKGLLSIQKKQLEKDSMNQKMLLEHYNLSKAVIGINRRIHNSFSAQENKLRQLKINNEVLSIGVAAAIEMQEQAYLMEAFGFFEENKSVLLSNVIKGNRARNLGDLPDSLAILEIELQEKKDKLMTKLKRAKSEDKKKPLIEESNVLNREIDDFIKSLKGKYPRYHALKYENISSTASEIQSLLKEAAKTKAVSQNTLLLEYFVAKENTYLVALSQDHIEIYTIPISKKALQERVKALRDVLSNYPFITKEKDKAYQIYSKEAAWFYKNYVKIALQEAVHGNIDHLMIVADGELGYLPFGSFLVEAAPQLNEGYDLHYLINDYDISYNYSATLWKENMSHRKSTLNERLEGFKEGEILACAAFYDHKAKYLKDTNFIDSRLPYHVQLRSKLEALPAVEEEVRLLEERFKGCFLAGMETNEAFFKNNAGQYGIIHLAMHGLLNSEEPLFSSLAFTENQDTVEDNFLQAYEISKLKLNANLVVLSACETGYGKFKQGEGVISLARSFMYAGVPSLVVSLWQVNDHSTAVIMGTFYDKLADGMGKAKALRQAKLDFIKNAQGMLAHPAFWSPFIQLGDNRPIQMAKKGSFMWWSIGAVVFMLMLGTGYVFWKKNA